MNYGLGLESATYYNSTSRKALVNNVPLDLMYQTGLSIFKWNLFSQATRNFISDRLTLSFGIRADATNYSPEMSNLFDQFSPRFSASYLIDQNFFLNFNSGRYYQTPPYTTLGFKDETGNLINKNNGLGFIEADHLVAGIEWLPNESSRLTVEGFFKYYRKYPFSVSDSVSISSKGADFGVFGDEEVVPKAINRSYGFEVLYRNRDIFGSNLVIAYTLVRSETRSFRSDISDNRNWIPTSWDNRHLLYITATRNFRQNWNLGLKWRFVGGTPYTPFDIDLSSQVPAWDIRGQGFPDYSRFNSERLRAFHQLDVRVDKQWFLNKFTINLYFDVQNLYNFKAEEQKALIIDSALPQPNPLFPQKYQLKELNLMAGTVLPTIGIIFEF